MIPRAWLGPEPHSLRSFSWKGVLAFLAFVAALSIWSWCGVLLYDKPISYDEEFAYLLSLVQRSLFSYLPIYVLVGLADGAPLCGAKRNWLLVGALVLGAALGVQARCVGMPGQVFWAYGSIELPYCTAFPTWRTYIDFPNTFITPLTNAGVLMVFVFCRRRDAELVAKLGAARTVQVETRRQRIESEIEAMRSRVDPDALLDTLRVIRSRYEAGVAVGEARLEDLIRALREAAGRPAPHPGAAE